MTQVPQNVIFAVGTYLYAKGKIRFSLDYSTGLTYK